ncbi:MAG: leucyl aminopeptidase [Hydrogenovibrio sp.]|uniref:leucyl aminopeptidase n=1 Tax=Hydrogenovibrio sp. TaxID=2065821 RepID=UPI00286FFC56|nr:leucyl aminopeptidase [Hydrogenovibrio sp.]MDR9498472.1 leucyl aminopeptidase [Hydrogenovibrio sp.]
MQEIQFTLTQTLDTNAYDTLVVPVFSKGDPISQLHTLGLEQAVNKWVTQKDFDAAAASTLLLLDNPDAGCQRLLLVGLGDPAKLTEKTYRSALKAATNKLHQTGAQQVLSVLSAVWPETRDQAWSLYQNTLFLQHGLYDYQHPSRGDFTPKETCVRQVTLFSQSPDMDDALTQAQASAYGMKMTQDLADTPANFCTPTHLADTAQKLGQQYGFEVTILEREQMIEMGMGAFMAVAQGGSTPPKMICLSYQGGDPDQRPIALVGKGVTFDTGGISLKPGQGMDEMKYDMGGAAAVLGTFEAIGRLKPNQNIVGVIPSTENMPSGTAIKPGDVVTSLSGQTIEILNTDAEGRLILCDALTYAQQTYHPEKVIDMATLTGACIIALGHEMSGIMGNDQSLVDALLAAGNHTYDRFWQLPLAEEYDAQLKSNFADMANIGGRSAGTITAGQFLARFTKEANWAHLDIAGTAWNSGDNKGATGRPVAALVHYLTNASD